MSGWLEYTEGDAEVVWLLCEHLVRDDGRVLGGITRFYADGPTYAWSCRAPWRLGPCSPVGVDHPTGWQCD